MSSTACWSWDAQPTSAWPNLDGAGVLAPASLIRATWPDPNSRVTSRHLRRSEHRSRPNCSLQWEMGGGGGWPSPGFSSCEGWGTAQYDEMVKYATALRLGTAETEAILRRFTRANVQHPTYKALAELGKAVKTVFLCRYLHDEGLRREINEGLNVIEHWNSANDFVFFARRGELASNRREDHEVSMLSLHLLQNCMIYVNTLMLHNVRANRPWTH